MSGDSKDDSGFTEGTLFDMDMSTEDSDAKKSAFDSLDGFDSDLEGKSEAQPDDWEDDGDKTSVLSLDDMPSVGGKAPAADSRREPDGVADDEEDEPLEKTFVLDLNDVPSAGVEESSNTLDEEEEPQDEKTQAMEIPGSQGSEEVESSEESTVLFQIPISAPALKARLIGIAGPDLGHEIELTDESIVLGRSKECDVSVKDPTASRKHIRFDWKDNQYVLTDLGSGNGTTVNDRKESETVLSDGDQLGLGKSVFRYDFVGKDAGAEGPLVSDGEQRGESAILSSVLGVGGKEGTSPLIPGIIGVLAIVVAMIVYFGFGGAAEKSQEPEVTKEESGPTAEEKGAEAFAEGMELAKSEKWEEAMVSLGRAANAQPDNEGYGKALARAEEEVGYRETFEKARKLVVEKAYSQALDLMAGLPTSTSISAEVLREKKEVQDLFAAAQIALAKEALGKDSLEDAKTAINGLLKILPTHVEGMALAAAMEGGLKPAKRLLELPRVPVEKKGKKGIKEPSKKAKAPSAAKKSAKPKSPVSSPAKSKGVDTSAAMSLYRKGRFSDAIGALEKLAKKASGSSLDSLQSKMSDIGAFESSYKKGKATAGSKAIKPLEHAFKLDKGLGGPYASELRPILADRLGKRAAEYYAKEVYGSAAEQARKALSYDSGHVNAKGVYSKCQSKASGFYDQGMAAAKDGNTNLARVLLKMVVQILSPGDSKRASAKAALGTL